MANRLTGQIELNANFEVGYQGPLDARLVIPEYPQLADPAEVVMPYPGMVVSVTHDENRVGGSAANNGLWLLGNGGVYFI